MQAKYRRLRDEAYRDGVASFESLAANDTEFRDFVCLYIAEGYKRDRNTVSVCNSDPAVIRMCNRWIVRLASNPVDYAVQFHADQEPADLARFWGVELDVHPATIRFSGSRTAAGSRSGRGGAATACCR